MFMKQLSVITTSFISFLGTLSITSSAFALTFPFPNTYGDVIFIGDETVITNALSNGLDDSDNLNLSGNDPIFAFDLEFELGLLDGVLGLDSGDTSAIVSEPFNFKAGDRISFDWTFLTNHASFDSSRNDFAFVIIDDLVSYAADTSGSFSSPGLYGFARQTSDTFSYTFLTDGTYQIGIGVSDVGDDITSSALLVENFDYQAVPEPEPLTFLGAVTALAFGTWLKRKIRP